ncbi:hypothetical protein B0T10DRAFT_603872 [Thelonectria olida]|uniref:Rhodopsin domain-containing protein n=1 Tax=Thelonectria olida TaxID=1576542 RepID=A0A9P8W9W3_9HYPO|nr:hypothetical protein B0T10DRAFT_603872 [Thelonectria olida]
MPVINGTTVVLPPPDGYVVDFDHPQRTGVLQAYYAAGFLTVFSLLCFAQRMYVKLFLVGGLGIDDVSWLTALVTIGLCLHMFGAGAGGVHGWEISVEKFNMYLLDVYLAAFIYVVCGSLAKIALLIFYLRLSPQKWFKMATLATIVLVAGYSIGLFFPLVFACRPITMNWDITVKGECLNQPSLYIATAVANIVSDIILFALPIRMVINLQIPQRQKIGLLGIFCVGSMTVVTSIVRVSLLPELLTGGDPTWDVSYASIWIIVEANLIIICASTPTLRKFFKHMAPKLIGESRYGSKTRTNTNSKTPSRTFGPSSTSRSRRSRLNYSQFDVEEGEGSDTITLGPIMGRNDLKIMGGQNLSDSDSERAINPGGTNSKAIVQTTTVTVEYDDHQQRR